MANIIDALIITLGLDASGFNDGQKKVSEGLKKTSDESDKTAKDMEAAGKRAASFFGSIRTEIIALAGISLSLGGLKSFVANTSSSLMELSIQSKAMDMSGKQLDGWAKSAQAAGSTAEAMIGNLTKFQGLISDIHSGRGAENPLFGTLMSLQGASGVQIDMNGNSDTMMRGVMGALRKLNDNASRTYASMLGIDSATLQADRSGGGKGDLVSNADKFTASSGYTDEAAESARKFNLQWTIVQQNLEKTRDLLFAALIPYIDQFNNALIEFSNWINTHPKEIHDAIKQIGDAFSEVVKFANQGADSMGGWKNAIEVLVGAAVGGKLLSLFTGLSSSLLGPAGLIAALLALQALVVKPYEDAHPELKNNPATNTLNDLPGANAVAKVGEGFRAWLLRHSGIQLPTANTGSFEEVMQQARDFFSGDWAARNATDPDLSGTPPTKGSGQLPGWLVPHAGNDGLLPSGGLASNGGLPRGVRNNNPGNLNYAGQSGAEKEGGPNGRFAVFPSMIDGIVALYKQLKLYAGRGIDTISEIVKKYAPAADGNNVGAYITSLMKATGKGANETLNTSDLNMMVNLIRGIINHENGAGYVDNGQILSGVQIGSVTAAASGENKSRASNPLAGITTGAAAAANYYSNHTYTTSNESSSQNTIYIDKMEVPTSAKTVVQLGRDVSRSVGQHQLITPSITGQG